MINMSNTTVAPLLRPASTVMSLDRLGSLSACRISFARSLLRQMARQRWQIQPVKFALDDDGFGQVIYRLQTAHTRYHIVVFSQELEDARRSDRVIADAWDLTFGLVEGDVEESLMQTLSENIPLQEAGRQHPSLLVISRANRSQRNFKKFVESLSKGEQPALSLLKTAGYLYRTTAVYGNGKFGIADYRQLQDNPDFKNPFSAQMAAVYVLRQFSIDQVEHIAARKSAEAATLDPGIKRYIGIGNSTGLGMAPFLINHPLLINQWILMRETALAAAKSELPCPSAHERLLALLRRAVTYLTESEIQDPDQDERNRTSAQELQMVTAWLEQVSTEPDLWTQLVEWAEAALSLETQELINSLLIELYPEQVDYLESSMATEETFELVPDMPLVQLKQLIETYFDWVLEEDYDSDESRYWFWYRSIEKEEPRLGVRGIDDGMEKELALAIGPRVRAVHQALDDMLAVSPTALTIDYLMIHARDTDIVRRIQTMSSAHYGEIRANLLHRQMKPMHLLRTKLSFLGAARFDPRSDRWVRVTFFQGAPLLSELNAEPSDLQEFDDWMFATAPDPTMVGC